MVVVKMRECLKSIQTLSHTFGQKNPYSADDAHDRTDENQNPIEDRLFLTYLMSKQAQMKHQRKNNAYAKRHR